MFVFNYQMANMTCWPNEMCFQYINGWALTCTKSYTFFQIGDRSEWSKLRFNLFGEIFYTQCGDCVSRNTSSATCSNLQPPAKIFKRVTIWNSRITLANNLNSQIWNLLNNYDIILIIKHWIFLLNFPSFVNQTKPL